MRRHEIETTCRLQLRDRLRSAWTHSYLIVHQILRRPHFPTTGILYWSMFFLGGPADLSLLHLPISALHPRRMRPLLAALAISRVGQVRADLASSASCLSRPGSFVTRLIA